jgi:hypothetical protein
VSKNSVKGIRPLAILPGIILGVVIGLLLTASSDRRVIKSSTATPSSAQPSIDQLSLDEIARLPQTALSRLCDDSGNPGSGAPPGERNDQRIITNTPEARAGILNTRRLLRLAKRLTIQALFELRGRYDFNPENLSRENALINAVNRIILDKSLGYVAAVQDKRLGEIRVGSGYAQFLTSDDEAVFLLAHELTHIAARNGSLKGLIETLSRTARVAADVEVGHDQREDLACDFIGTQVLKRYIELHPTDVPKAERLFYIIGYELPSERLARALDDFCASYNGAPGDEQHLSQYRTVRALAGLDPELNAFIDAFRTATAGK